MVWENDQSVGRRCWFDRFAIVFHASCLRCWPREMDCGFHMATENDDAHK